jgi:hypothetical protein
MKWVLAIGIAIVAMTVAVLGVGMVGMTHYCMPPIGHITPMIINNKPRPF